MRLSVLSLPCLLGLCAVAWGAEPAPRYLPLINHAFDSVVRLQAAPEGAPLQSVALDRTLRGGGESQIVTLAGGACRYDLRFEFSDGRTLRYDSVDLCRYGQVRIRPLPRAAAGSRDYVVSWRGAEDAHTSTRIADQQMAPPSH
ncbi:MAG TPA: hypothetical protein VGC74_04450 [Stenotrophomonas sp.]